jgi:ABC-type polysaccharide/polyol phosphate transport system ATPase subunit
MTVHLQAHDVSLELPVDMQRLSSLESIGMSSALSGNTRRYATVLSRISFSAGEGDRIALLGLNGAGKTTLLRVLNGAFPPTRGSVSSKGTMQSLLNATLGFSEHASLVENVILRGTAMGLRRRQLQKAMGDILEFAGLRDRASHRLHTLSAGQRTRLGFAISTSIQPDILLMDEWIATGDAVFLKRAQDRLMGRFKGARIVVLASHNSEMLRHMCTKALVLDGGRMRHFGDIEEGIAIYRDIVSDSSFKLREQAGVQDPLLFGDVRGFVERISLRENLIEVEGWAIGSGEREVELLCVEIDGQRHVIDRFDRIGRDDVLRATAKRAGRFGFKFSLSGHAPVEPTDIAVRLRVSIGNSRNQVSYPLQMAVGSVIEAI